MRTIFAAAVLFCLGAAAFGQAKPVAVLSGYPMGSQPEACVVTVDGKTAIVAGSDKTLRLFDLTTGKETQKTDLGDAPNAIGVTADGKNITIAGNRGPLQIYDNTGKMVKELAKDTNASAISSDGLMVAASVMGGTPNVVTLFSIPDGNKVAEVKLPGEAASLSFSADHSLLAIGLFEGKDNNILLADAKTGQIKNKFQHGTKQVKVLLSPDGGTIASNGNFPENKGLKIFDVKSGKSMPVEGANSDNARMAFYPDGKTLLYSLPRNVQAVDVGGAKVTGPVTGQGEGSKFLVVTADKKLLRGQPDGIEVWDLSKP